MRSVLLWAGMGLLFGMAVQGCGFSRAEELAGAATFRRGAASRTVLYLLGIGMVLTAGLCYLAVIDVDWVEVVPLHGGTVLGGVLFGLAVGLAGIVPGTTVTGLGGGRLLESLCGLVGCVAGACLGTVLPLENLHAFLPQVDGTVFRLTLVDPWLMQGGFLGLACLGVLLCVVALFIPVRAAPEEVPQEAPDATPLAPEELREDAFVALLPEEEPMVVDTALEQSPFAEDVKTEELPDVMETQPEEEAWALLPPQPEDVPMMAEYANPMTLQGILPDDPSPVLLPEENVLPEENNEPTEENVMMKQDDVLPEEQETHLEGEQAPWEAEDERQKSEEVPILEDHPELEESFDADERSFMEKLADMETQAGVLTPTEELDMPSGARAPETMVPLEKDTERGKTEKGKKSGRKKRRKNG